MVKPRAIELSTFYRVSFDKLSLALPPRELCGLGHNTHFIVWKTDSCSCSFATLRAIPASILTRSRDIDYSPITTAPAAKKWETRRENLRQKPPLKTLQIRSEDHHNQTQNTRYWNHAPLRVSCFNSILENNPLRQPALVNSDPLKSGPDSAWLPVISVRWLRS